MRKPLPQQHGLPGALLAVLAPFAIAVYYFTWKYLVGHFNAVLGVA